MRRALLLSSLVGLLMAAASAATYPPSAPNDPYFPQQWALSNDGTQSIPIDVDPLHTNMQQGTAGADIGWLAARDEMSKITPAPVTVAVIDTGIDPKHPDLVGRLAPDGFDFINAAYDSSHNLPNDTLHMSDMPDGPGQDPSTSEAGHGTHVSGVIAANADNGIGIVGITPSSVRILPLKILSDSYKNFADNGELISDHAADAINYAVAHGASIINLSLGWPKVVDTANARQAVTKAIQAGVLIVAAAGNDRKDLPTYPCAYDGVLCVGAVTNTGAMALYSNLGGRVDLLAPGDNIISTYPTNVESQFLRIQNYEVLSGTSMASPQVAGVAAAVRAAIPGISLEELEARLLISGAPPPAEAIPGLGGINSSLYGMVNLKRALDAKPAPVYLPDFKSVDEVTVDENTLRTQGQISVENLWAPDSGVQAEITVNGLSAGTAQAASLAQGAKLVVPWKYTFSSLDDSSLLNLSLRISDASGNSHVFSSQIPAARAMDKIAGSRTTSIPATAPGGPILSQNAGQWSPNVSVVASYPARPGEPEYFMQHRNPQGGPDFGATGSLVDLFDFASANPVQTIQVPGIQKVIQVLRLNASGVTDGAASGLDWVVIGAGNIQTPAPNLEFYFLNSALQPLWGANGASQWQISLNSGLGQSLLRDYSAPGSWVLSGKTLVPCFITQTALPGSDNFGEFDMRHYQADQHLIYLLPQAQSGTSPIQLQIRALDNASFRSGFTSNPNLKTLVPPDVADAQAGHLRALLTIGTGLDAQTLLWDIPSTSGSTTHATTGWDQLSTSGVPMLAISTSADGQGQSAYLSFFDQARGSLAWATSQGQFLDRTEFTFASTADPIAGLIGAFELPLLGRFWFVQSQFDLVGYHQSSATGNAGISLQSIPIDRDSSFADEDFSNMFKPVLVGTSANPLPGVYIDSTLVRGNMLSVAVLKPASGNSGDTLEKPLRYSLQVPDGCAQGNPVHMTQEPESFAVPILCLQSGTNQASFQLVFPQPGKPHATFSSAQGSDATIQ